MKAAKVKADPVEPSADLYLKSLVHPFKAEIDALRQVILGADSRVREGIKWNAPSFFCHEWFATFNLRARGCVQLIFHRGAKVKAKINERYVSDPTGLLDWITNDRCSAKFTNMQDVKARSPALKEIVAQWVRHLSDESKSA